MLTGESGQNPFCFPNQELSSSYLGAEGLINHALYVYWLSRPGKTQPLFAIPVLTLVLSGFQPRCCLSLPLNQHNFFLHTLFPPARSVPR